MSAFAKVPVPMTVAEFLAWDGAGKHGWQLVDGQPEAMAPGSRTHAAIQSELARLLGNHLADRAPSCSVLTEAGVVPRVQSASNLRIPDLAVTCSGYDFEEHDLADPVLIVEIISPSNRAETWGNVWAYTTIPSVQEILVVSSTEIGAELLRRGADGAWPPRPDSVREGELVLESIGFRCPIADLYRTTRLRRSG